MSDSEQLLALLKEFKADTESSFSQVNGRFDGLDERMGGVEQRLGNVETGLENVERRVAAVELEVKRLSTTVNFMVERLLSPAEKTSLMPTDAVPGLDSLKS